MEQQYARDLKTLRQARQHKVLKSYGILDDGNAESDDDGQQAGYATASKRQ